MGFMSLWMFLGLLVFLAVVAGAVYVGIQLTRRDDDHLEGAQQLLDRRLASGEISPEEYAERQSTLRSDPPPGRS
jgi:uncharacterized membrane protein